MERIPSAAVNPISIQLNDSPKHWMSLGVVIGLGVMNKHTFVLYVLAVLIPYVWIHFKSVYKNRFFYLGVVIAVVIVLPNLIWQYHYEFPSLEFYKNAYKMKNINLSLFQIIFDQILSVNPATFPLWYAEFISF